MLQINQIPDNPGTIEIINGKENPFFTAAVYFARSSGNNIHIIGKVNKVTEYNTPFSELFINGEPVVSAKDAVIKLNSFIGGDINPVGDFVKKLNTHIENNNVHFVDLGNNAEDLDTLEDGTYIGSIETEGGFGNKFFMLLQASEETSKGEFATQLRLTGRAGLEKRRRGPDTDNLYGDWESY